MYAADVRALLLVLFVMLFLVACSGQKVKLADGTETLASVHAIEGAEASAQECLEDAKAMWDDHITAQATSIPAGMSEVVIGMLLISQAHIQQASVQNIVAECMAPIMVAAEQFNATDRQKMSLQAKVAGAGIIGGFTYLSINSIANAFAQGMANAGSEYNIVGPGGRQIKVSDDDHAYDDGFEIFGGDRTTNDDPNSGLVSQTQSGGNPPISNSGDGDVVGNTMNISINTAKDSQSNAITDIPNFSPDPVTGGEVSGEGNTIRANP